MAEAAAQTTTEAAPPQTEPLGNQPDARAPDGTLKDSQATQPKGIPPETKPEAKAEDKKPADAAKPPTGAPEKYAEFKPPEGYTLDEKFVAEVEPMFRELGLSQEGAQRLLDFYGNKVIEMADAPYKQFDDLQKQWRDTAIKDPTIGNGTDNLKPEVQVVLKSAIDSLEPKLAAEFREALDITGAGNNPAFVKAFYNLYKDMKEGSSVKGGGPSPGGQGKPSAVPSAAQALYPNLPTSSAR